LAFHAVYFTDFDASGVHEEVRLVNVSKAAAVDVAVQVRHADEVVATDYVSRVEGTAADRARVQAWRGCRFVVPDDDDERTKWWSQAELVVGYCDEAQTSSWELRVPLGDDEAAGTVRRGRLDARSSDGGGGPSNANAAPDSM
jgi:hypothetical protein